MLKYKNLKKQPEYFPKGDIISNHKTPNMDHADDHHRVMSSQQFKRIRSLIYKIDLLMCDPY